jgi:hypothetical protein
MDQSNFDIKSGAIKVRVDGSTPIDNLVGGAAASASAVLSTLAVPAGLFIAQKMVQKDLDQDNDNDIKGKLSSVALNVVDQTGKAVETMPQNLYDSLLTLLPNKKKTRKNKRNQANSNSTSKSKASKRKTRKN